jgi:transcription initiation factor TFIIIB Brf1 subunit/transcription initiation factor TFIIB
MRPFQLFSRHSLSLLSEIIISKKDKNTYTSGKAPMGLAAFALYIVSANNGEKMSQREIANAG